MTALRAALERAGQHSTADRLQAAAMKALTDHPRDWDVAWASFRDAVWSDPDLSRAAFQRFEEAALRPIMAAAAQEIHRARRPRDSRTAPANPPCGQGQPTRTGHDAVIAAAKRTLLDTFTINGQQLGDVSAEVARAWAWARRREARFIGIITAGIMPSDTRPLRQIVTAEEAEAAFKRAGEIGNE